MTDFRGHVRAWLEEHCPPEMRVAMAGPQDRPWGGTRFNWTPAQAAWRDAMVSKGWTTPSWPREYGGAALSESECAILQEELDRIGARPAVFSYGISMLGPALLKFGSESQKRQHLLPIARGEIRWCQGYSEPGAGSDLASLKTKAEECGEHFLVNGQKIWTSYAHLADWMFCLVRTSTEGDKRAGISFLLFDMSSTGVETRPITLISGESHFCEVFLNDVKVPKIGLVGAINQGWQIATYLLEHERKSIGSVGLGQRPEQLSAVVQHSLSTGSRHLNAALRCEVARTEIDQRAFDLMLERLTAEGDGVAAIPAQSAVIKYCGTELNQRRHNLIMALSSGESLFADESGKPVGIAKEWLFSRGDTVKGGTSEIQLNIIARQALELPK